jgi:hypothetical protein
METDLPFRNAFPIFLRNVVTFLMTERSAWIHDQYHIGDVIEPLRSLPADVREVGMANPREGDVSRVTTVPVQDGRFLFDQTLQPGPWRFTFGDQTAYTAVNLTDARESRITPLSAARPVDQRLVLTGRLFGTVPWRALAVLAASLIGLEWLTYHFRWTE